MPSQDTIGLALEAQMSDFYVSGHPWNMYTALIETAQYSFLSFG